MLKYLNAKPIDFTVALVNEQGEPVTVTSIEWSLLDEAEQALAGETITEVSGETATITIAADHNTVSKEEVREARLLTVTLNVDGGSSLVQRTYYLVEAESVLVVGQNSFVTYLQALKTAPSIATLKAWGSATEEERKTALEAAHANIARMSLSLGAAGEEVDKRHMATHERLPESPGELEAEDWPLLSKAFKKDFALAQMLEADFLLDSDGVDHLRAMGVLSYTVGETKSFYRTQTPLELGVTKTALRHIGKYLSYNARIGRA